MIAPAWFVTGLISVSIVFVAASMVFLVYTLIKEKKSGKVW